MSEPEETEKITITVSEGFIEKVRELAARRGVAEKDIGILIEEIARERINRLVRLAEEAGKQKPKQN